MKTNPPADPPFQNREPADWAQNANLLLRLAQRTFNYNYMSWANWLYVGIQFGLGVSRFTMLPQVKAHYFRYPIGLKEYLLCIVFTLVGTSTKHIVTIISISGTQILFESHI